MGLAKPVVKKGRKYDQVLDGAREVFLRDGFEGASVDDIARAAGVSKATLYSYFPDKRLLFMEVARIECCRQADEAVQLIDVTAKPSQVLRSAGLRFLEILLSDFNLRTFRICCAEADRFPELGQDFYQSGPLLARERLSEYLSAAVERGELAIDDMDLAADQFAELCKADLFPRALFGVQTRFSAPERARVVDAAVAVFLSRYATGAGEPA